MDKFVCDFLVPILLRTYNACMVIMGEIEFICRLGMVGGCSLLMFGRLLLDQPVAPGVDLVRAARSNGMQGWTVN